MHFALMQRTLDAPAVEKLQRAFRGNTGLVPADAQLVANDAFGILVKGRTMEEALALQTALQMEEVDTAIVAEGDLPELPPTQFVSRLECLPEALVVHDSLGRPMKVAWSEVLLVAGGQVKMTEFNQKRQVREVPKIDPGFGPYGYPHLVYQKEVEYNTKEEYLPRLLLEIILKDFKGRYSVVADKAAPILFQYLGARGSRNLRQNYSLLMQDLAAYAPQAIFNRGTMLLRENPNDAFLYPSKNAFFEEIIWLLWQLREARGNAPTL